MLGRASVTEHDEGRRNGAERVSHQIEMRELLWVIIELSLFLACVMDCRTCRVYNLVWWISGTAALGLLLSGRGDLGAGAMIELGIFIFLQLHLFSKMYGRADCYAFIVCSAALTAEGFGFWEYLCHMSLAFSILLFAQLISRNINNRGNLKHPVPFLPYITLAFWALLWYHNIC